MSTHQKSKVNKRQVAAAFGRAARRYDQAAILQQQVGDHLLKQFNERIELENRGDDLIGLDAGCGTGLITQALRKAVPKATLVALDLSSEMLHSAKLKGDADHYTLGDIEALPFPEQTFDFVITNLAIQWCHSFTAALKSLYRVLKPGGILLFSTVIDGSLYQLEEAWRKVDNRKHILDFLTEREIGQALKVYSGEMRVFEERYYYSSILSVLRSLQNVGATTLPTERAKGLMGRKTLSRLAEAYPKEGEQYPLSYYILIGEIIKG